MQGLGPKSLRALALIAELVYGAEPSFRDPARFSFAHGGKDGHPYPVDRDTYDRSIAILRAAVERSKIGNHDRMDAMRRLDGFRVQAERALALPERTAKVRESRSGQMVIQGRLPL